MNYLRPLPAPVRVVTIDGPRAATEARDLAGGLTFRAPHYTVSEAGIADELGLAVGGVLYLDEAASFRRGVLAVIEARLQSAHAAPAVVVLGHYVSERASADEAAKLDARLHAVRDQLAAACMERAERVRRILQAPARIETELAR